MLSSVDTAHALSSSAYGIVPAPRLGASQNVAYPAAGNTPALSAQLGTSTYMIEINTKVSASATGIRVAIGANPVATATSKYIGPGYTVYYKTYPGEFVSVIADDNNQGTVNIVEISASNPGVG